MRAESAEQTRDGLMAVLQWKPSKDFESVLDVYHSKFERIALQRGFEAGLAWSGASLQNPVVEGATAVTGQANTFTGGVLTKADYVGAKPIFRHDHNEREDKLNAIGWNNKLVMGDWTLVGDISWSKADRNESILELYSGTVPGSPGATDTFSVVLPQGGGYPNIRAGLNYADPSIVRLVDSGGWGQAGYLKNPEVKDEIKSLKLAARSNVDLFGFSGFDLGVNYTEREKSRNVPEWFLDLKASPQALASSEIVGSTSLAFVGMPNMVSYDPRAALGKYYNLRPHVNQRDILNKIWTVNEEITTGFVKGDIDTELFGDPAIGNSNLRPVSQVPLDNVNVVGSGEFVKR